MLEKHALCIGINAYEPSDLALTPCIHDSKDLSHVLGSLGFQSYSVNDVNHKSMTSAIHTFTSNIQRGSIVVFYFSGHGVQYDGRNYLIPRDARNIWMGNVAQRATDVQKVINMIHTRRPRVVICILDCCRTDPPTSIHDGYSAYKTVLGGTRPGLAPMQAPPSTIVAYACAADDVASARSENNRNSLYTSHLLRYIRIPNVDIETTLKYVAADVQKESRNKQIPFRYSSCNEMIYLGKNRPPMLPFAPHRLPFAPYMMQKRYIMQPAFQEQPRAKMFPVYNVKQPPKNYYNPANVQHDMLMNRRPIRGYRPSNMMGVPFHNTPMSPQLLWYYR